MSDPTTEDLPARLRQRADFTADRAADHIEVTGESVGPSFAADEMLHREAADRIEELQEDQAELKKALHFYIDETAMKDLHR